MSQLYHGALTTIQLQAPRRAFGPLGNFFFARTICDFRYRREPLSGTVIECTIRRLRVALVLAAGLAAGVKLWKRCEWGAMGDGRMLSR